MIRIRCVTQKQVNTVLSWFHDLNTYDRMMGDPGGYGFCWKRGGEPLTYIPDISGHSAVTICIDDGTDSIGVMFEEK